MSAGSDNIVPLPFPFLFFLVVCFPPSTFSPLSPLPSPFPPLPPPLRLRNLRDLNAKSPSTSTQTREKEERSLLLLLLFHFLLLLLSLSLSLLVLQYSSSPYVHCTGCENVTTERGLCIATDPSLLFVTCVGRVYGHSPLIRQWNLDFTTLLVSNKKRHKFDGLIMKLRHIYKAM